MTKEDNNIIPVRNVSILLLISMSDRFFCTCLMRDVLLNPPSCMICELNIFIFEERIWKCL